MPGFITEAWRLAWRNLLNQSRRRPLRRADRIINLELKIGERPEELAEHIRTQNTEERGKVIIPAENLSPEAAREMNRSSTRGELVTEVMPGRVADVPPARYRRRPPSMRSFPVQTGALI